MIGRMYTFAFVDLSVDLNQDSDVAAGHDQQGDDVERDEMKHVVDGLMPALPEATMGDALSEVYTLGLDCPEDKELFSWEKNTEMLYLVW